MAQKGLLKLNTNKNIEFLAVRGITALLRLRRLLDLFRHNFVLKIVNTQRSFCFPPRPAGAGWKIMLFHKVLPRFGLIA